MYKNPKAFFHTLIGVCVQHVFTVFVPLKDIRLFYLGWWWARFLSLILVDSYIIWWCGDMNANLSIYNGFKMKFYLYIWSLQKNF